MPIPAPARIVDVVAAAHDYWQSRRGDRAMPARSDLDPLDLTAMLPNLMLLDVLSDPLDFRYRLIGTEIDRHSGRSYTGKTVREIPHRAPPSTVWDNLVEVVDTLAPSFRTVPYVGPHEDFIETRQVILPLSSDGTTADKLMIAIRYLRRVDLDDA